MLQARGYTIHNHSFDCLQAVKPNQEQVHVFFSNHPKFKRDVLKEYYAEILKRKITHCIIVYRGDLTSAVQKTILQFPHLIELFKMEELQFNITTHALVPKHEKVHLENRSEVQKFPILRKTDPVSRFYGFQTGDVIRITRRDGSISFRCVR